MTERNSDSSRFWMANITICDDLFTNQREDSTWMTTVGECVCVLFVAVVVFNET